MIKVTHVVLNEFKPDFRVLKEAKSLKQNYEVNIIALNDKENSLKSVEHLDNICVYRVSLKSKKMKSKIFLPLKYLEVLIKATILSVKLKPSIIHVHDFSALAIGYFNKIFTKSKMIYDSHEYWADCNFTQENPAILNKITRKYEHFFSRKSDRVITVSDGIANLLHKEMNIMYPEVIMNAPYKLNQSTINYDVRQKFNINKDSTIITYIGGILPTRGFELVLEAFINLGESDSHLLLIGNRQFPKWLERKFDLSKVKERIHFIPPVHPTDVIGIASQADIGIHAIRGGSLSHQYCMPNKLFEYIQSGLALLMTDLIEMKKVVDDNNLGLTFKDGDVLDLSKKLSYLVNNKEIVINYKENSRSKSNDFNWEIEEKKLLNLYKGLISND